MSKKICKGLLLSNIKKDYTLSIVAKLKGKKVDLPLEYAELTDEEYEEILSKLKSGTSLLIFSSTNFIKSVCCWLVFTKLI